MSQLILAVCFLENFCDGHFTIHQSTNPPAGWPMMVRAFDQLKIGSGDAFLLHHLQRCMFTTGHPGAEAFAVTLDWALANQVLKELGDGKYRRGKRRRERGAKRRAAAILPVTSRRCPFTQRAGTGMRTPLPRSKYRSCTLVRSTDSADLAARPGGRPSAPPKLQVMSGPGPGYLYSNLLEVANTHDRCHCKCHLICHNASHEHCYPQPSIDPCA